MCHDHIPSCHGGKMILEKETYEKFGYYPGDLKPKSNKKIIAACANCGKIRELRKNSCSDFCRSCTRKGEKNPLYGKQHSKEAKRRMSDAHKDKYPSKETRKRMSDARTGEKNYNFGKHHSEGTRKKMREARKHQRHLTHHTKPELIFEEICKKHSLPFKYTGNGSLWIGKKGEKQLNPDFAEANGKKICVEIMGAYWHSRLLNRNLREDALLPYREKHYKKYKWIPVFIWDTDLLRKDTELFILNEIQKCGAL